MNHLSLSWVMSRLSSTLLLFLLISNLGSTPVHAQIPPDTNLFQWKFSNNFLGTQLPSCLSLPITVEPVNATNVTHGIPPFYMIAWEIGGTPKTTLLGLNESSLTYTVDHPIGTSLMLNVVDSQGNGGGIPPEAFTVTTGQSTECIVSGNQTDFTVSANISSTVQTCQRWGLQIKGGSPPYNISLAQFQSPVVTNLTMLAPDNVFTYINRATPGYLLLAAVSDVTGRYAFGTPTVMPEGSDDSSCVGLGDVEETSEELEAQEAAEAAASKAKARKRAAILAGVLTPLLILSFGAAAYWGYRYYTRQQREKQILKPEPLTLLEPKILEEANTDSQGSSTSESSTSEVLPSSNIVSNPFTTEAERTAITGPLDGSSTTSASRRSSHSSGFAKFPTSSVRRPSNKAIEAGYAFNQRSPASSRTGTSSNSPSSRTPGESFVERSRSAQVTGAVRSSLASTGTARSASLNAVVGRSPASEREYIFQHQDGGRLVRELPPPYERRIRPEPDVPLSPFSPS